MQLNPLATARRKIALGRRSRAIPCVRDDLAILQSRRTIARTRGGSSARQDELADEPPVSSRRIPNQLQVHDDVKASPKESFVQRNDRAVDERSTAAVFIRDHLSVAAHSVCRDARCWISSYDCSFPSFAAFGPSCSSFPSFLVSRCPSWVDGLPSGSSSTSRPPGQRRTPPRTPSMRAG